MDWDSISIGNLELTETEHRYYGDIFIYCCENAECKTVPVTKLAELLRSANLPRDIIAKILEICTDAKGNKILGRKQFYAALKLVAAHQAGLEIYKDSVTAALDVIALPRFTWPSSTEEDGGRNLDSTRGAIGRSGHRVPESTTESESEAESPRETGGSTDSPTPTNSVTQERGEGTLAGETILDSVTGGWQGLLVYEEQRQLLGTEEESSERHSSDDGNENGEGNGESSGFPPEEVWIISEEQREYYAAQFAQLQPDPEGLLAGPVARMFFEKSRLPVAELRHIWQLADVTRDGALSLQEFYIAMHLVVLRRNHVPLPDVLPPSLSLPLPTQRPSLGAATTSSGSGSTASTATSISNSGATTNASVIVATTTCPTTSVAAATATTVSSTTSVVRAGSPGREKSKEWTKFVDSPTGNGGSLTSPGPKPVNFDFQKSALERDPLILHPVPLRLTPEAAILASGATDPIVGTDAVGLMDEDAQLQLGVAAPLQRPLAKKPSAEDAVSVTPKKEPPPPPPPRPYRTHTRSSSLDLNKLGKNGQNFLGAPPLVPPRVSPGITSPRKLVGQRSEGGDGQRSANDTPGFVADFSQFSPKDDPVGLPSSEENIVPMQQQFAGACGAFHIYRKPASKAGEDDTGKEEAEEERLTLQELREKNAELRLVCEELTRELATALQERINLRAKLMLLT
ncbi:ralBP1-associated Eps domain-containing protein 2 [Orussus abietinus]|uniref:ralBP1-associated Eps domain-containing protein 2 n=1 Tax=Orussus abietinus TaxID=222816 RepID=UPI0006253A2F|nr:ralBP1-associated Eps domain-containing protein 2 [Orussus abietinus]XP_012274885.1 ralBP1-associated Eps domain-containing protein 2 [Orussus abietinus]XP_012274886.1 ralBP1-associated Eps domain-containing protein 2 [Orussus abietinus]XP_023288818.1 ralBP1-associated Eps domain-containing protein 2 [Orussus abietinus]